MTTSKHQYDIQGNSFRNLLFFLLVYIVGSPFMVPYESFYLVAHASLTVVLFFAVFTVQRSQGQRSYALIILMPLLALYWLGIYGIIQFSQLGAYVFFVFYYGLLVYCYVQQIVRSYKVTLNVLYTAFCLYLLVGLFWGALYSLLEELSPGAYSGILFDNTQGSVVHVFNYFSMVTLTTLGYGDITPQTAGAASLCQLEAIVGQFFIAVLVAWLVGNFIADRKENEQINQTKE
jgi:voltage-gated potassium channel